LEVEQFGVIAAHGFGEGLISVIQADEIRFTGQHIIDLDLGRRFEVPSDLVRITRRLGRI